MDPSAAKEEAFTSTLVPKILIPEEETSFNDRTPARQLTTPTPSPSPPPAVPPVPLELPAGHKQYSPKMLTLMQEFALVKWDPPNLELERVGSWCLVNVQTEHPNAHMCCTRISVWFWLRIHTLHCRALFVDSNKHLCTCVILNLHNTISVPIDHIKQLVLCTIFRLHVE